MAKAMFVEAKERQKRQRVLTRFNDTKYDTKKSL